MCSVLARDDRKKKKQVRPVHSILKMQGTPLRCSTDIFGDTLRLLGTHAEYEQFPCCWKARAYFWVQFGQFFNLVSLHQNSASNGMPDLSIHVHNTRTRINNAAGRLVSICCRVLKKLTLNDCRRSNGYLETGLKECTIAIRINEEITKTV